MQVAYHTVQQYDPLKRISAAVRLLPYTSQSLVKRCWLGLTVTYLYHATSELDMGRVHSRVESGLGRVGTMSWWVGSDQVS